MTVLNEGSEVVPTEPGFYQFERLYDNKVYCYAFNGHEWMFIDLYRQGEKIHTRTLTPEDMVTIAKHMNLVRMESLNDWGIPSVDG